MRLFSFGAREMGIVKTTYKDQVTEHVYNLVLDGELNPGDQIKESMLAAEMGISRAPIRESFKELITNGIIQYKPQVGNFIALLSPREIVDAYTTRGILEGYAIMETRDRFSEEDLEQLQAMILQMEKAAKKENRKMVVQVGGEFHDRLISKNRNIQLIEYTERLSLKLHVLFNRHWSALYSPDEIGDRHQRIVACLGGDDPFKVEQVIRQHYTETGTKIAALQ